MNNKFKMIENKLYRYYNHSHHHGMFFNINLNNKNIFLENGTLLLFLKEGREFMFFFYNGKIIYTDNIFNSFIKQKMYIPINS